MKHPIQPLARDSDNVLRFKENKIVRHLLDAGSINLHDLTILDFSDDDRAQFAQLRGYSLTGFGELSYVNKETYELAEMLSRTKIDENIPYYVLMCELNRSLAKNEVLAASLAKIKKGLKIAALVAFDIHPDDLGE